VNYILDTQVVFGALLLTLGLTLVDDLPLIWSNGDAIILVERSRDRAARMESYPWLIWSNGDEQNSYKDCEGYGERLDGSGEIAYKVRRVVIDRAVSMFCHSHSYLGESQSICPVRSDASCLGLICVFRNFIKLSLWPQSS
jgi:hypothetical protein